MCGEKAVCARTGCTEYIRNSTAEYLFYVNVRFRQEGEVRLGSCLYMKCNIMIYIYDDVKIVKIYFVVHEI